MGIYIPNMSKPKRCIEEWDFGLMGNACKFLETDMSCLLQPESEPFDCGENYNTCPLIEIDIVTCGECKHWNDEDHWCNIRDSYGWDYKPTDFCSYGEKKTDETDEEWYDWRDEQEYEDRWERRGDGDI